MTIPQPIREAFQKYGLEENHTAVYLYLVRSGDQTPFYIARETKIPRTSVYRILDELKDIGLVSIFKKNNVAYYSAENPRRLIEKLKETEVVVTNVLPDINAMFNVAGNMPQAKLYVGDDGAKAGLDTLYDYLEKHAVKQLYTYSNSEISKYLPKYLDKIIERRERLKIHVNMIAPYQEALNQDPYTRHYRSNNYREVRFLPEPFTFEGTVIIGGAMAVFFSLKDGQIHTVVLESESIVAMLKQFFMFSWSVLRSN